MSSNNEIQHNKPYKQLLMRSTSYCTIPPMPDGYTLHQFHRGGDDVVSLNEFREGWLQCINKAGTFGQVGFDWYYDDQRIPEDGIFVVLDSDKQIVSTATVQLNEHKPNTGTVHMVSTDPDHCGKALGRIVTGAVVNYILDHGYPEVYLTTDDFRIPAVRVYIRLGFLPVFYESDMRTRWIEVLKNAGLRDVTVINEQGENERI